MNFRDDLSNSYSWFGEADPLMWRSFLGFFTAKEWKLQVMRIFLILWNLQNISGKGQLLFRYILGLPLTDLGDGEFRPIVPDFPFDSIIFQFGMESA